MKPNMTQTIVKVSASYNRFGDLDFDNTGQNEYLIGKFRYITQLQITTQNREQVTADAMAWFNPDSGVVRGDVLHYDGEYFRVEKVVKARDLDSEAVHFIKCYLVKDKAIVS